MKDAGLEHLATARLHLRRYTLDDFDDLARLDANPEVMRYIGGAHNHEQSVEMLENRILAYYPQHPGMGVWATIETASGAHIGFHLLNHVRGEDDLIQVGYRLSPEYWGKGYATEMNVALLRYGFTDLGLPLITAHTHPENTASQHVLKKSGLRYVGTRHYAHPSYASMPECSQFERQREEWLAERR